MGSMSVGTCTFERDLYTSYVFTCTNMAKQPPWSVRRTPQKRVPCKLIKWSQGAYMIWANPGKFKRPKEKAVIISMTESLKIITFKCSKREPNQWIPEQLSVTVNYGHKVSGNNMLPGNGIYFIKGMTLSSYYMPGI